MIWFKFNVWDYVGFGKDQTRLEDIKWEREIVFSVPHIIIIVCRAKKDFKDTERKDSLDKLWLSMDQECDSAS